MMVPVFGPASYTGIEDDSVFEALRKYSCRRTESGEALSRLDQALNSSTATINCPAILTFRQ
jgi:hypothetical protein